jgi:putative FmdB family regulatory protein
MPVYEYRCDNGHTFEVLQRMSDEPVARCDTCGSPVQRVFHPVAVHFKGSGFYNTDYGKQKRGAPADEPAPKSDGAKESKADGAKESKADGAKESKDKPASTTKAD